MLEAILNWSFRLLIMGLCILWWHRCHKYAWPKITAVVTTIIMFFGMAVFEGYYLKTGKLPWFFGLEGKFAERHDAGPAFFLILLGIATWFLVAWLLPKFSTWWNAQKYTPGSITKMSICGIGLMLLIFVSGNASANVCHSYGYAWGTEIVSLGGNICADASELGLSENDRMQNEFDESLAKTERRAPVQEHRHTSSRSRGR